MIIKVPVDNLQGIALLRPLKGPSKMNKLFIQTTIEQNALRMSGSRSTAPCNQQLRVLQKDPCRP